MPASVLPPDPSGATCPTLAADRTGTLYRALGSSLVASETDGARRWLHHFPGNSRIVAVSDGAATLGVAAVVASSGTLELVRLSETGDVLWTHPLGALRASSASLVLDSAGGVALVAPDLTGFRVNLLLLDAQGKAGASLVWPDADSARIVRATDGKLVVARHSPKDIRFTWLSATGDAVAEHVWGVVSTNFLMAAAENGTVVAVANSPWSDAYPAETGGRNHLDSIEPVFLKLGPDGHVDYQLIPEQHGFGSVDVGRVDGLAIDRDGNVWFEGNMSDRFGLGPFAARNESLFSDNTPDVSEARCGRFLSVLDRRGDPVWAHTLANQVTCKVRPVGLVATPAGAVFVAFNHRGDIPLHVPGEPPAPRGAEGCRTVRFDSLSPVELAARDYTVFPYPDRGRDLGVLVDGRHVP